MNMDLFETVRERVTAREAAEMYGVEIKHNRARCIWHDDRRPSLSFKDDYCHCFACENGGSAIDVAMQLHGLPVRAAAEKLNIDFGLGVITGDGRCGIRPREPTAYDARNAVKEWYDKKWNESCEVIQEAQAILVTFTDPETASDDPRFEKTIRALCRAQLNLNVLESMNELDKIKTYRKEVSESDI